MIDFDSLSNVWMFLALILVLLGLVGIFIRLRIQRRPEEQQEKRQASQDAQEHRPSLEPKSPVSKTSPSPKKPSFQKAIASWIPLLQRKSKDREQWEEVLITSDMGPALANELLRDLEASPQEPEEFFRLRLKDLLKGSKASAEPWNQHRPWVLYLVGVNGVGKTTSLVKLGQYLSKLGKRVGVVGADTFRKAAIEQLERQCVSASLDFFTRRLDEEKAEGVDPSSVIFDGLQNFQSHDVILVDTSGRLHNKKNLMEELKKMKRVGDKALSGAPQDIWLVLDATLGQNALSQAENFHSAIDLSGLILTKMDGLSRGGAIFQIYQKLGCPIWFLGMGETADDLVAFNPDQFVEALFTAPEELKEKQQASA